MSNLAQAMMAKIDRGFRLESADEMTGEYRENLVHLLTMQADSELAGGYGYVPWITKAPTVEEKHVVAQIVKDELRTPRSCTGSWPTSASTWTPTCASTTRSSRCGSRRPRTSGPRASRATSASTSSITRSTPGPTSSSSTSAWTAAPATSSRTCASAPTAPGCARSTGSSRKRSSTSVTASTG